MANTPELKKAIANVEALKKAIPKSALGDLTRTSRLAREFGSQIRVAQYLASPKPFDQSEYFKWEAERRAAPVATRRAVEHLLEEVREGSERERRMLRLTVFSIGVAILGVAAAITSVVLFVVLG